MKFFIASIVLFALVGVSTQNCSESFKKAFLSKTNELRAKHGVGSLSFDNSINSWAQDWANNLASKKTFQHRPNNKYGENLYMSWSSNGAEPSGDAAVQSWYDEIKDYHYFGREPDMSSFSKFGHFTQLVWKGSQKMGVGCGKAGNNFYVVANYSPAGNMVGSFAANVPAPK